MSCDLGPHRRKSTRLSCHDDASDCTYFGTIVTRDRICLLGVAIGGRIQRNEAGFMIQSGLIELPERFRHVRLGAMVIMPNHIRLSQQNDHEMLLRTERAVQSVTKYIVENPRNWDKDRENPLVQM